MDKHLVSRNYWWIASAVTVAAIAVIVASGAPGREGLIATTLGTALTFCYFMQKQKLEELRLFKELFTDFNHRYDTMNAKLEDLRTGNRRIDAELRSTLVDYFNLCAEEYLFFKEGYIHREVWSSWCRGMVYYLRDDRIRQVWNAEMVSDSHYGLTLHTIEQDASKR